jgi:TonB family protein
VLALVIVIAAISASGTAMAQQPQLSLADILIGLRSKKVTLTERNRLLTDAVLVRGITFSLTPEIEKELEVTGADQALIDSIRKKSPIVKVTAVTEEPVGSSAVPAPTPAPPDFSFYQKRGDASLEKGDLDAAVIDYGKVLELKPASYEAFLNRGRAYSSKKWFDLAVADFSRAIEIDPKRAAAFAQRGEALQKKGDLPGARADYQKAVSIDPAVEPAKGNLAAILAEDLKAKEKAAQPPIVQKPVLTPPEFVDMGQLTNSNATRMVTPVYSPLALKASIGGIVRVEVSIDEEGNVTSAKAVEGHQFLRQNSEDAARRSKFRPAMFAGQPIKARGFIVYNFNPYNR